MIDVVITKELMQAIGACDIGPNFFTEQNLWGQPESVVLAAMRASGMQAEEDWWLAQKRTEAYVRYNGKEITVTETYQVFNPFTGLHTEHITEAEARAAAVEIAKTVLQNNKISVCRAIANEHGDTAWTAVELSNPVQVV